MVEFFLTSYSNFFCFAAKKVKITLIAIKFLLTNKRQCQVPIRCIELLTNYEEA